MIYRKIVEYTGSPIDGSPMRLFAREDIALYLPEAPTLCQNIEHFAAICDESIGGSPPPFIAYVWNFYHYRDRQYQIRISWGSILSIEHGFFPPLLLSMMRDSAALDYPNLNDVSNAWEKITEQRALIDATRVMLG